jgi:release factor glutamine methyltransferase
LRVGDALDAALPALAAAGCDTPRLDAELLIADALGADRALLHASPERAITGRQARLIGERVRRRVAREPVAYILGRRGFRRIEVIVDSRVLIPRPETELLVEVALELPPGARVHEVGTGSGAVALALLDERPDLAVSASDASAPAVEVARANAERLGLPLEVWVERGLPRSGGGGGPGGCALGSGREPGGLRAGGLPQVAPSLVLANLPYVREDEWDALAPEIRRYEPREALVSGPDGLDAIRELCSAAPPGTRLALEHAPAQAAEVRALLRGARTLQDLAGRERVTVGDAP